jgi:hypothetical protein
MPLLEKLAELVRPSQVHNALTTLSSLYPGHEGIRSARDFANELFDIGYFASNAGHEDLFNVTKLHANLLLRPTILSSIMDPKAGPSVVNRLRKKYVNDAKSTVHPDIQGVLFGTKNK